MSLSDLVIRSQLIPPRSRKGVLHRPRISAQLRLALDYPLTIVHAGTGYGKSTALASLPALTPRVFWFTISEPDRDPLLFLVHLLSAFTLPDQVLGAAALQALEENGNRVTPAALTPLLNTLTIQLPEESILVLDDYHLVQDVPEISALISQLINYRPPALHLIISTRQLLTFDDLPRWRVKGQVLTLTSSDLAFTADEIETLFQQHYGYQLTPEQAHTLALETEGWIMALQMVWQSLQSGAVHSLDEVFTHLPDTLEALFEYLAPEVLSRQPKEVQTFLLYTSVLRKMDAPTCAALLHVCPTPPQTDSAALLRHLYDQGLFLESLGEETYRYQRLFQDFLQSQLKKHSGLLEKLHQLAAEYYDQTDQPEETIFHLLQARLFSRAADKITALGSELIRQGRLDSLTGWIDQLPAEETRSRPEINLMLGDIHRLRANFDPALQYYIAAGESYAAQGNRMGRIRALRGQAQVFLDTIRPLKADALLEEASRLMEPQEHRLEAAALFDQLAENKLNLGYPDQAQALHAEARMLRAEDDPGDVYLEARAMLRTGRLGEARRLLEARAHEEIGLTPSRPQRFHRETLLLLSLICSMLGDYAAAEKNARAGIITGQQLQSNFVEAVGYMRLGHPLQSYPIHPWESHLLEQAARCYQRAIDLVQPFKVMRVSVEPLWGLCRLAGYSGDLLTARQHALRALDIADQAGDEWIADLVRVSYGASLAMAGEALPAVEWLERAIAGFIRVGDSYGCTAAQLWLALNAFWQGDLSSAMERTKELLPLARANQFDDLLITSSFIGLKDDQAFIPLLLEARQRNIETAYVIQLLEKCGCAECEVHPGYTLRVRTLGMFAVWRGDVLISETEWQREKARQLFQLLITQRGKFLQREQITELLWPDLPPDIAIRDFKVALNALTRALEPSRRRENQFFFTLRRGNAYALSPAARIDLDVLHFERLASSHNADELRRALAIYRDDYLPECRYTDWVMPERERLLQLYLAAAGRLVELLLTDRLLEEAISVCQTALARDRLWEPGYRLLMQAHLAQGNSAQARAVYQRCASLLREELGVEPSPETQSLFAKMR